MRQPQGLKDESLTALSQTRRLEAEGSLDASRAGGAHGAPSDEAPDEPRSILGGPAQRWAMFATIITCLALLLTYWALSLGR